MEFLKVLNFTDGNIELYEDGFEIVITPKFDVTIFMDENQLIIDDFMQGKITKGAQVKYHDSELTTLNTVNALIDVVNEILEEIYDNMQESIRENNYFNSL